VRKPRIGIVGLGNIAQKAYLPILSAQQNWSFIGAFSPTESKRNKICRDYRIRSFASLPSLYGEIDAAFVHSSTETHYEVVSQLLQNGIDVYVDKPLAATLQEAEKLVELSVKTGRKLMVGFNRRFAPLYLKAKAMAEQPAMIRIEKHRINSVNQEAYETTMLDDYIHLVDLARWLAGDEITAIQGKIAVNEQRQLLFACHGLEAANDVHIATAMHRKAGTNLERVEWVCHNRMISVSDLEELRWEEGGELRTVKPSSWETILERRGFLGAVEHFIQSIVGDTRPATDGEEALKTQRLLSDMMIKQNL
jgi:virulence factor